MQIATILAADNAPVLRLLVGIIIGGGIGAAIGNTKNRVGLGALLGALLGCIGWIIIAVLPKK